MKLAIYQMDIIPGDPEANRKSVQYWAEEVIRQDKPDVLVLPEMWTTAYTLPQLDHIADVEGEPTLSFLKQLAHKHDVHIVGGSYAVKSEDDIYNRSVVINRRGEVVYQYDKIHLVPMLDEPSYFTGGKHPVQTFELDGIPMGLIICYDLRFPELARSLALDGAQILFVVAEWPQPRRTHWEYLQIARAIENQLYVVSANRVGTYNEVTFCGHSMVVDPGGTVVDSGSNFEEQTVSTDIDLLKVTEIRQQVPVFENRVPHLYKF